MKPTPPTASRLRIYGLAVDDWWALFARQGGRCPACMKAFTKTRPAAVDHNHRTGAVRGLLCVPCNRKLGELHENIAWLRNAAEYLSIPPAESVFETPRLHRNTPGVNA